MKIKKHVIFEKVVEFDIDTDDIAEALSFAPNTIESVFRGLNNAGAFMKSVTDEQIARMNESQKDVVVKFFNEQLKRFDRADHVVDADKMMPDTVLLKLVADIRAAVGDSEGKLMQDELVQRCGELAESSKKRKQNHLRDISEIAGLIKSRNRLEEELTRLMDVVCPEDIEAIETAIKESERILSKPQTTKPEGGE